MATTWIGQSLSSELASAGRFAEAASRYKAVTDRLTAEQHYSFGYFFTCAEDFVSARIAFLRAIRLDSEHDAKKFGIGIFHEKHRRWDLAATAYRASAEDTSDDQLQAEFYRRAGYCFEAALELTSARSNYDQALEYAPRNREVWREMV